MPTLLKLDDVTRHFGGVQAVDGVSIDIEEGTIFGLIGPNGAGKTTLVNLITGYVRNQRGSIQLAGQDLAGRAPHQIAAMGVGRTFQTIRLYRELTAVENVLVGMHSRRRHDTLQQLALLPVFRRGQQERVTEARGLLEQVGLDHRAIGDRKAHTLAYGDQRRLEVARALALRPRLLILDEPAAGMNPSEKERMRELIESINAAGLTVLMIDHDMRLVMGVCRQIAVLNFGRRIAAGTPAQVSSDQAVITAYLGTRASEEGVTHLATEDAALSVTTATAGADATRSEVPEAAVPDALLAVSGLTVTYGAIRAVRGVDFFVRRGEIVSLIGANGAGKSTILNTLSGVLRPAAGTAVFDGVDLARAAPSRIVSAGLVQVPEGREILARLTVRENLELGTWSRRDRAAARAEVAQLMERFPILGQRADVLAGQLSGGEQQLLAIARALLARPRLLLMDEPSLGLAPQMVDTVFDAIDRVHRDGTTILLVEQNALRALEVSDRAYVIETGEVLLTGTGRQLLRNPQVRQAYLGA